MPRAERLDRKWDEDETFTTTGLKRLIVFAIAGDVEGVAWLPCGAVDGSLLKGVNDGYVESRIFPADPPADEDICWARVVSREEMTILSAGGQGCGDSRPMEVVP